MDRWVAIDVAAKADLVCFEHCEFIRCLYSTHCFIQKSWRISVVVVFCLLSFILTYIYLF